MKYTITTIVTDDMFRFYIPIFVYSARRANPEADIKIFYRGSVPPEIKELCDCEFIENVFANYPESGYTTNALRFLVPPEHFTTKYIYFTDIDFIMLPHKPSLFEYQRGILKRTKQMYAGHRGPKKVTKGDGVPMFDGNYTRIAAGAFFCLTSLLNKFDRPKYLKYVKEGGCDYRSFDEVMLCRMLKKAGQLIPETKGTFLNGKLYNIQYRDIHLGDFKFTKRWKNMARMKKKFLTDWNIMEYHKLCREPEWHNLVKFCSQDRHIAMYFNALNKHIEHRGIDG